MNKKFKYAELKEQFGHGTWLWLLDDEIVNPSRTFMRDVVYDTLSLVEVLNLLGKDSWQVVNIIRSDNQMHTITLMKEYYLG